MYYYVQIPYYCIPRSESIHHLWNNQEITQNDNFNENYPLYPFRTYSLYTLYYPSNFTIIMMN